MGSTTDGESNPATSWLGDLSRRAFLRRSAVSAAVVGVAGSVPGLSAVLAGSASEAPALENGTAQVEGDAGLLSQPLVAHVKDLNSGEISLFQGEREVLLRDPALARRLLSAARP